MHNIALSTGSRTAQVCGHRGVLMENAWHLESDPAHISGMVYSNVFMGCVCVAGVLACVCCDWDPCG